jgi:hypothetical protein
MLLRLALTVGLALTLVTGATTVSHAQGEVVVNVVRPSVTGDPAVGATLTADPGEWTPGGATYAYQWLRDGVPIAGADRHTFQPRPKDELHELYVRVTASAPGSTDGEATSEAVSVHQGTLVLQDRPTIDGVRRLGRTLVARPGSWDRRPDTVRYQWLRGGTVIAGARGVRHRLVLADFGRRISVRVTALKDGYGRARATSGETRPIGHRVPVRHVVRYHVETRGDVSADVGVFKRQAQQTYDDPRGWRGSGIRFRRVASGGAFTLVLAEASQLPRFSSGCSAEWSCRVGRFVIINQTRWLHASPMWHQVHRSLRDYRHMVVNHETGHWLGWDHRSCPDNGAPAPVMQQQSKGLDGCRANPWPTAAERNVPRF